jgi:transposase-like protein
MGIIEDWLAQRYLCPKCASKDTEKTIYHKQAFDTKKGTRREYTKWVCKECKHEFWK